MGRDWVLWSAQTWWTELISSGLPSSLDTALKAALHSVSPVKSTLMPARQAGRVSLALQVMALHGAHGFGAHSFDTPEEISFSSLAMSCAVVFCLLKALLSLGLQQSPWVQPHCIRSVLVLEKYCADLKTCLPFSSDPASPVFLYSLFCPGACTNLTVVRWEGVSMKWMFPLAE